jgi:hypothetical protein
LHRNLLPDGRVQLVALHHEGMIKKIPTNQVIVTPNASSNVKLDELNRILKEMETGQAAIDRLKELDNSSGMVDPYTKRKAEAEYKRGQERQTSNYEPPVQASSTDALDDRSIATNMLSQAKKMEIEAKGLIAEAARMKKDAQRMYPKVNLQGFVDTPNVTVAPASEKSPRRGRPPKSQVVSADAVQ